MSTGYGWEGIRQVCATLLGARHVPERLYGGACLKRGEVFDLYLYLYIHSEHYCNPRVNCTQSDCRRSLKISYRRHVTNRHRHITTLIVEIRQYPWALTHHQ